jgi:hypothetical protein
MKRPIAACIVLAFFVVIRLTQISASTALVSPAATPTGTTLVSPLGTPLAHYDPSYNPNPKKIRPRAVPFVNQAGETIVKEIVYERPYHDPIVIDIKAQPQTQPQAAPVTPLTFQFPLGDPYPYHAYLPIVVKQPTPNAQVLVIAYIGETPWYSPTVLANQLITNIQRSTSFHGTSDASIVFEMVGGDVNFVYAYPPLAPPSYGGWDLPAIYQQFNICNRVASEGIDEV